MPAVEFPEIKRKEQELKIRDSIRFAFLQRNGVKKILAPIDSREKYC